MTTLLWLPPVTYFFKSHCLFKPHLTDTILAMAKQSYLLFSSLIGMPVALLCICCSIFISIFKYCIILHFKYLFIYSLFWTFILHKQNHSLITIYFLEASINVSLAISYYIFYSTHLSFGVYFFVIVIKWLFSSPETN